MGARDGAGDGRKVGMEVGDIVGSGDGAGDGSDVGGLVLVSTAIELVSTLTKGPRSAVTAA